MQFFKYQGAGNDFILFDNRTGSIHLSAAEIQKLCDRRFGIGADGLMLLNSHPELDFEMKYFNADGNPGSLCGNGSRCIVRFACDRGIEKKRYHFFASDGPHEAELLVNGLISLKMNDLNRIESTETDLFLDTGSPHVVKFVQDLEQYDVFGIGKAIRYDNRFSPGGTNVNFAQRTADPNALFVRTYERGVENETYSCGTGVTACAIALAHLDRTSRETRIETKGGTLTVRFQTTDFQHFHDIHLIGPAEKVFEGTI